MRKLFDVLTINWGRDLGRRYKKPKRGDVETEARSVSAQDRAGQTAQYGAAGANLDTAQGTYGQFEGPVEQSPFYKAMLKSGTEGTAGAYQSAKSNVRRRAAATGFGGAGQPIAEGATEGIESEEAKAQSRVPGEALTATAPLSLEAARGTTGIAGTRAGMGTALGAQGAEYFTRGAVPLEQQYQDMLQQRQKAMWDAISKAPAVIGAL